MKDLNDKNNSNNNKSAIHLQFSYFIFFFLMVVWHFIWNVEIHFCGAHKQAAFSWVAVCLTNYMVMMDWGAAANATVCTVAGGAVAALDQSWHKCLLHSATQPCQVLYMQHLFGHACKALICDDDDDRILSHRPPITTLLYSVIL